jgi:hypothetical protein
MPLGDSITAGSYGNGQNGIGGYRTVSQIIANRAQEGMKVQLVDLASKAAPQEADFSPDRLHPNDRGHTQIGKAWFSTLRTVLPRDLRHP